MNRERGTDTVAVMLALLRLARPHQWVKNGIVLIPLIFAGEAGHINKIEFALLATVIFCLISSAMYTINDLADIKNDRAHPRKKDRPLASGQVSPGAAVAFAAVLMAFGITGALWLSQMFALTVAIFVALNLLYSLVLKHVVIIDVMAIGLSFVLRAFAGAVAISVEASTWMLINTLLLALFLGFGKRRAELTGLNEKATEHRATLSRYSPYLLDQLIAVTTPSVVVMYMLYSFSSEVEEKLQTEYLYLTIPFVIYGIFRYLYLIHREERGGSPTRIMLTDRPILAAVVLWLATSAIILYVVPN